MRTTLLRIIKKCLYQARKVHLQQQDIRDLQASPHAVSKSRRKALQTIGMGLTGLTVVPTMLTGNTLIPPSRRWDKSQPSIAILGGGIAGLHCAWILKRQGIRASIYEASSRAGGRIYTLHDRFGQGLNTEAGGEFIDSNHADMLSLAEHFNLPLLDITTDEDEFEECIFHFGGQKYGQKDLVEAFQPVVPILTEHRLKCGEDYDTEFAAALDRKSLQAYLEELPCDRWVVDLLIAAYVGEYGLDADEQSSLNFLCLIGFPRDGALSLFGDSDERYKIQGGNQQIIYKLVEDLGDQIEYGKVARAIQKKGRRYNLHFEEGQSQKADIIVCTIPFTVLRHIDLQIDDIDPIKSACIHELGYGQNNKLLLGMEQRIWRMGSRPTQGYTYDKLVHTGWDHTHMQGNNHGQGGFTVFLGGSPSLALASHTTRIGQHSRLEDTHLDQYLGLMERIYAGFRNSYTDDHEVITWSGNPFTRSSYSCYKVGQWSSIAGKEIVPIDRTFLFAGEHCSSEFQGFMNGAAETGRLAAEGILEMVGVKRN